MSSRFIRAEKLSVDTEISISSTCTYRVNIFVMEKNLSCIAAKGVWNMHDDNKFNQNRMEQKKLITFFNSELKLMFNQARRHVRTKEGWKMFLLFCVNTLFLSISIWVQPLLKCNCFRTFLLTFTFLLIFFVVTKLQSCTIVTNHSSIFTIWFVYI